MLEAPALCPAGEGGSGVATGAMRKIRHRVQREKAAPVSRLAEGSSGITFSGRRLRRRVGRRGHHVAAGGRRGPGGGRERRGDALAPRRRKLQHRDRQAEKASASYLRKEAPASRPAGGEALVSRPARRRSCVVTDRRRGPGIGTGVATGGRRGPRRSRRHVTDATTHRRRRPRRHDLRKEAPASRPAGGGESSIVPSWRRSPGVVTSTRIKDVAVPTSKRAENNCAHACHAETR